MTSALACAEQAAEVLSALPPPWSAPLRADGQWAGEIVASTDRFAYWDDTSERGIAVATIVRALCDVRNALADLLRLVRIALGPEQLTAAWVSPEGRRPTRHARHVRGMGKVRKHRATILLRVDAPHPRSPLYEQVRAIARELSPLPAPWSADIDCMGYDSHGQPVEEAWTGKVYTGRARGSWCWYHDEEDGVRYTPIVLALCELRNVLPELLRVARSGAEIEREAIASRQALPRTPHRVRRGSRRSLAERQGRRDRRAHRAHEAWMEARAWLDTCARCGQQRVPAALRQERSARVVAYLCPNCGRSWSVPFQPAGGA